MLKTPKILKIMNGSNLLVNINCAINNLLLDWEIKVFDECQFIQRTIDILIIEINLCS